MISISTTSATTSAHAPIRSTKGDGGFVGLLAAGLSALVKAEQAKLAPKQYSAAQLASLVEPYRHHWNAAAYFVVAFASIILLAALIFGLGRTCTRYRQKRRVKDNPGEGESYLMRKGRSWNRRPRPSTRILNALRGKEISLPMPSEDGHSEAYRRGSEGTSEGSYTGENHDATHGW
jgi:hypothetical protein